MPKEQKPRHVISLPIITNPYEEQLMNRSFHALSHIHNVLVKHVRKLLIQLEHDHEYQELRNQYLLLAHKDKDKLTSSDKETKKQLSDAMKAIRQRIHLTDYDLQSYIKVCGKQYRNLLSSQQVQKEATRVWRSVVSYLFGKGKSVHFKKFMDFDTISGKTNLNGMRFDPSSFTATWLHHTYRIKKPSKASADYVYEALDSKVCYCDVKRIMFPNGWHYYLNIVLEGPTPKKLAVGNRTCGIDPGVSTMAAVSEDRAVLRELAPDNAKYAKPIREIQYHMDRSRRQSNPNKYNLDGTINKENHERWVYSKTYFRLRRRMKYLYAKRSRYIRQSHCELANDLLKDAKFFYIEDMNYSALGKKSSDTKRSEKTSKVVSKSGTIRQVHKFKRKKRFGRTLNNRAPAAFVSLLKQKAELYGGRVESVKTKDFKASQYNHTTDTYTKVPLSQRQKVINGHTIQRDLYSAFLILNTDDTLAHPDREKCFSTFNAFVKHHDECINVMKNNHQSMKQCFGF